jgi:hypothetical protein
MRARKYFWLAVICLLMTGAGADTMAQDTQDVNPDGVPTARQTSVSVDAIQVSDGERLIDPNSQRETTFGLGFLGRTTGDLPGSVTFALNVTNSPETRNNVSAITGGPWTLPVYMTEVRGGFAGSIFGTISDGVIIWDRTNNTAQVSMTLKVEGGTLAWDGATGSATFDGTLVPEDKSSRYRLRGKLSITLN